MRPTLVTGAAGFIGFHVATRLLARGERVVGIDDLNDYYDPGLKLARLANLDDQNGFDFEKLDLADRWAVADFFEAVRPGRVIHLAAQVGVRYSLENPYAYIQGNLVGFANVLEGSRQHGVEHLVYASSSSVYGANTAMPFAVHQNADHPVSLYAATKKSNELMAHSYSHLYGLPCTGLRFFTVYGPWGRPDMALFRFTRKILAGQPIDVFNHGNMLRDFTYVDDVVRGVVATADHTAEPDALWSGDVPDPASSSAPYRLYNIGNNRPVQLEYLITVLEEALGRRAVRNYLPIQPGDALATWADVDDLAEAVGFRPATPIEEGVARFVEWYLNYYEAA